MTRDALPRAYLRIDPNIDQVYPELRSTFVGLLCAAHRQPARGRFRDRRLLEALCGRAYVGRAFARGDVVEQTDATVYVVGWDEWQEGDMTVADRMRRMRDRRKRNAVTPPPSPRRHAVTTDASSKESTSTVVGVGVSVSVPPNPPPSGGHGSRATRTNPRALADFARRADEEERDQRRAASRAIHQRYLHGEINEVEERRLYDELDMEPDDLRRRSA